MEYAHVMALCMVALNVCTDRMMHLRPQIRSQQCQCEQGRTSAVTKTMLYVALMVSLSPGTCVLSALEASVFAECLSASRLSPKYVATPSEALVTKGLTARCLCLSVSLQTGA